MYGYDYIKPDVLTGMNRFLVDVREKRMARYLEDLDDLRSRVNGEIQTRDDYAGREILELLQNAVDASDKGGKILVELADNVLRVCNNGTAFTEGGINSILIPNLSPKNEFENLGNKGLGFRSLLNDSKYVTVYSGGLSIRMSAADAMAYKKLRELPVQPPVLSVPRVIEPLDEQDFVTMVQCELKDAESVFKIKHQIEKIDSRSVIFLPKISEIELRVDSEVRIIRKTGYQQCQVEEIDGQGDTMLTNYYVARRTIKHVETGDVDEDGRKIFKDIHITIARNINDCSNPNNRWSYLYNAFPTKVRMPTGWIVNANFALNADRNAINEKLYNWRALQGAVDLMFAEAEKMTGRGHDFAAIETLIGDYEKFDFSLAGEKIEEYFMQKLRVTKLLPGVNGNYLALADKPYFYRHNLTQYLQGEGFENTVMYCENGKIDDFMTKFNSGNYFNEGSSSYHRMPDGKIAQLIDNRLNGMAVHEQIELSVLFMKEYGNLATIKPNFFVDQDGARIGYGTTKYTGSDQSVVKNVPRFLQIRFIQKEFVTEIHQQTGTTAKDFESSEYAKYYNIKQYRLLNIAEAYQKAVEHDAKRAQDYLYWLFTNEVSVDVICGNGLNKVSILSKNGDLVEISMSVLPGGIYEELFPTSSYVIEWFGDDSDEWRQFLLDIGSRRFPLCFGWDFTEEVFKRILQNHPFEQICRLLNSQTWLCDDAEAKNLMNSINWIEYRERKYAPTKILLDSEYGEKFDGYLGLEESVLRRHLGLKSKMFDSLKFNEGIINLMATDIYEILTQLPKVDRRGRMAKRIYRALVKDSTVEEKMLNCTARQDFVKQGEVFCKGGQYHPVSETCYFAKGLLPSAVLKDRNLVEIDKKRGAKRVKNLFGVERLAVDFYVAEFKPHIFQKQFIDALQLMKIGVLSTEKLELFDESKRDIKTLRIQLCSRVNVVINGETRVLENYEFAMKKNAPSEYCLKIPEARRSFDAIRYDLQFINAIVEMFVMRIGTGYAEDNSDSIARVIETRDLRQFVDLQENGTERYNEAAKFMGETIENERPTEEDIYETNYSKLRDALLKYEEAYLRTLYDDLQGASVAEQIKFESLRNGFLKFRPDDDAVLFDVGFDAEKYVCEQFAIRENTQNDVGEELWCQANTKFGETLNYYDDLKSLARFGHFDEIRAKLAERKQREQEMKKRIAKADNIPAAKIVKRDAPLVGKINLGSFGGMRRGGFGGGGNSGFLREIGYTGQEVVKKTLRDQGFDVRDWSGEAIRSGTNVNASDSYGYDLTYVDDAKVTHYIEVKSHIDRVKHVNFEMSKHEFGTATHLARQPDAKYEIYLVDCLDASKYEEPELQVLDFVRDVEHKMVPEIKKYCYVG